MVEADGNITNPRLSETIGERMSSIGGVGLGRVALLKPNSVKQTEVDQTYDPLWREKAICRDIDPNMFYSDNGVDVEAAREFCKDCPSNYSCLEYALVKKEKKGVWGGASERERRRIKKAKTPRT